MTFRKEPRQAHPAELFRRSRQPDFKSTETRRRAHFRNDSDRVDDRCQGAVVSTSVHGIRGSVRTWPSQ